MDTLLLRAMKLKQALLDYIDSAEGELAIALERYSAEQLAQPTKFQFQGQARTDWMINRFLTEAQISGKTPIACFLEKISELTDGDRALVRSWENSFIGLFEVTEPLATGFTGINWLTGQPYQIQVPPEQMPTQLGQKEILLSRIAPLDKDWMVFGPQMRLGKLGKPKLAVAIGHFKHDFPTHLYGDAPDLLEAAWQSVEQYHEEFVDFFGQDQVTLPGEQMGQQLQELQAAIVQKRMNAVEQQPEISEAEFLERVDTVGLDPQTAKRLFRQKSPLDRLTEPAVSLPDHLKQAATLTLLVHPRWGQVFLADYCQLLGYLKETNAEETAAARALLQTYLTNPEVKPFVWQRLAQEYPVSLETLLRSILNRPGWQLKQDLPSLLQEFHHSPEPALPETASVPLHLHQLFETALLEVQKQKKKPKGKATATKGFGR